MIRRFIKLKTFIVKLNNDIDEKEKLFLLAKIHSAIIHNQFDDALMLFDGEGKHICDVKMTMDELIAAMKIPIEIEI